VSETESLKGAENRRMRKIILPQQQMLYRKSGSKKKRARSRYF